VLQEFAITGELNSAIHRMAGWGWSEEMKVEGRREKKGGREVRGTEVAQRYQKLDSLGHSHVGCTWNDNLALV